MRFARMQRDLLPGLRLAHTRLDKGAVTGIDSLLAIALCVVVTGVALAAWDGYHAAFDPLHRVLGGLLPDRVWEFITRFGDERILLVLALLFARRRPEIFWAMVLAAVLAALYSRSLKHLVDAMRPPAVLPAEMLDIIGPKLRSNSFPSGHTTSIFVFVGVLFAFARHASEQIALIALAVLVGLSRVALGVHWPQDILAGAFGGLLAAALGTWISVSWRAGLKPGVHLGMVLLPIVAMPLLLISDNGNPSMPWLTWPLVFAMSMQLLLDYRVYRK